MARIVLDAFAEADLGQHLEIVARTLLDALRFDQLVLFLEERDALGQFHLDGLDGAQSRLARRDVMAGGIYGEARHTRQDVPGERIEQRQRFHLVVEQGDAHRVLAAFRRKDVDHIATHAERAALRNPSRCVRTACRMRRLMTSRCAIFSCSRRCRIMPW